MFWLALSKAVYGLHVLWTILVFAAVPVGLLVPSVADLVVLPLIVTPLTQLLFRGCLLTELELALRRRARAVGAYGGPFVDHLGRRFLGVSVQLAPVPRFLGYGLAVGLLILRSSS